MSPVQSSHSPSKRVISLTWLVMLPAVALVACGDLADSSTGSDSEPEASIEMPDLVSSRLDVAISDLAALGVNEDDIEVVGGGSFGVLDESNWTVCEQRPGAGDSLLDNVRLIVDRSCPEPAAAESSEAQVDDSAATAGDDSSAGEEEATEETREPDSPVRFLTGARGDLRDMRKDLKDMEEALDEGGFLRVAGNVLELSFNIGQLQSLEPPVEVANEWDAALTALEVDVARLGDLISDDGTPKQVNDALRDSRSSIRDALGVLDAYEESLD